MELKKFTVKNYKALKDISFEIGSVNVFIGTNGAGKSSVLEALGILSASVNEQVDDDSLFRRGVRLGTPKVYKSSFNALSRQPNTIEFMAEWIDMGREYGYKVNLSNPTDNPETCWSYFSETLSQDGVDVPELTRGQRTKKVSPQGGESAFSIEKHRGILSFYKNTSKTAFIANFYDLLRDYAIYTPSTECLRGVIADSSQRKPIGLHGGRLEEAISDLLSDDSFGTMDIEDLYELLDWVKNIEIGKPLKDMIPTGVPTPQRVIQFTDRYMKDYEGKNRLSSYDASEGALYVLFVLALSMHPDTPKSFAIDNFDQAMNPRLTRAVMKCFSENIIRNNKLAFVTTHNPLLLEGLDLTNPKIKLFTMDRDSNGFAEISEAKIKSGSDSPSISKLWLSGALGGVPNL